MNDLLLPSLKVYFHKIWYLGALKSYNFIKYYYKTSDYILADNFR